MPAMIGLGLFFRVDSVVCRWRRAPGDRIKKIAGEGERETESRGRLRERVSYEEVVKRPLNRCEAGSGKSGFISMVTGANGSSFGLRANTVGSPCRNWVSRQVEATMQRSAWDEDVLKSE